MFLSCVNNEQHIYSFAYYYFIYILNAYFQLLHYIFNSNQIDKFFNIFYSELLQLAYTITISNIKISLFF